MIPDPKETKKKRFSKDPSDIAKSLERDYPGFKATLKKGTKDEFNLFKGNKSISVVRKVAHGGSKGYTTGKDIAKAINSKKNK
jgi:hypothetical protein